MSDVCWTCVEKDDQLDSLRAELAQVKAEIERWKNITARKDPDDCAVGIAEMFGKWKAAETKRDAANALLRECLGAWTGDGPPIELDRIRAHLGDSNG